jgi:aminomethyltransferase
MSSNASAAALLEDLKQTPLHEWHKKQGARMVPFVGYEMPVQYPSGIITEHNHTREKAGLFDISHMGVVKITEDPDYIWVLERLIPIDIKEMTIGQMRYGVLLSEEGYILDDLIVSKFEKYFLIVINAGCKDQDYEYMKRFLRTELFEDTALLALQGPKAREVMRKICEPASKLPFMTMGQYQILGQDAYVSCSGYTGEDGFEIIIPSSISQELADQLLMFEEVKPIGLGARDSLRLEAGLCLYGHDVDATKTPVTAGLTWSLGKRRRVEGDFVGDELILEQLAQGVPSKRVGLKGLDKAIAREGAKIFSENGQEIGIVTSGVPSPTLGFPVAMGYVDTKYSSLGNQVKIEIRGQHYPFEIIKMPFVQHNYYRG